MGPPQRRNQNSLYQKEFGDLPVAVVANFDQVNAAGDRFPRFVSRIPYRLVAAGVEVGLYKGPHLLTEEIKYSQRHAGGLW